MTEDRKLLGGISRETFVNPRSDEHERGLLYDILSGIDSKIQSNAGQISDIKSQCSCRLGQCKGDFGKLFIKRFSEKIPLSTPSLLGIGAGACFLVGYGALKWETVLKWVMAL